LGKTTLAGIVAAELQVPLRVTKWPRPFNMPAILAAVLVEPGTWAKCLFLDEIHRMARSAEEMLYLAMEDYRVDVIARAKVPAPLPSRWNSAPFTLVAATTRAGALPGPLRDRFGFTAHLDFYGDA
jgi:Holliday junction DNA helicase RuvB